MSDLGAKSRAATRPRELNAVPRDFVCSSLFSSSSRASVFCVVGVAAKLGHVADDSQRQREVDCSTELLHRRHHLLESSQFGIMLSRCTLLSSLINITLLQMVACIMLWVLTMNGWRATTDSR